MFLWQGHLQHVPMARIQCSVPPMATSTSMAASSVWGSSTNELAATELSLATVIFWVGLASAIGSVTTTIVAASHTASVIASASRASTCLIVGRWSESLLFQESHQRITGISNIVKIRQMQDHDELLASFIRLMVTGRAYGASNSSAT